MMMYGWDGWGWGGWMLMTLVMIIFWALVIIAVVLAIRYLAGKSDQPQRATRVSTRAEDVLPSHDGLPAAWDGHDAPRRLPRHGARWNGVLASA